MAQQSPDTETTYAKKQSKGPWPAAPGRAFQIHAPRDPFVSFWGDDERIKQRCCKEAGGHGLAREGHLRPKLVILNPTLHLQD